MKHSFLKRGFILILALMLCLSSFAMLTVSAEDGADAEYEAKKTAYRAKIMADDVTEDDFLIGSWVSFYSFDIDSYEYQLDQMAAAGINFNIFPKVYGEGSMHDAEYWNEIEETYGERNMVYLMGGSMNPDWVSIGVEYAAGKEHCIGYHVKDEPSGNGLPLVAEQMRAYRDADPTRYPFTNLLPSYAGEAWLGGTYRWHIETYVQEVGAENVGYLSHDNYPFLLNDKTRTDIFADMEVLRKVAYDNGKLKTHAFPQSTAWASTRMPNIDEMRWNVYGYLAYGFKALSWFNLVCPGSADDEGEGFHDSLIYRDGTIRDQELFDAWSELNWEVRGLSDILMSVDVAHAYHVIDNAGAVELLTEDYFLQPNRKFENNFIISDMESKSGDEKYIMLFNKDFTKEKTKCLFDIDASEGIVGIDYFDPNTGEYIPMNISNGTLVDTFKAGEGKLYRLNYTSENENENENGNGNENNNDDGTVGDNSQNGGENVGKEPEDTTPTDEPKSKKKGCSSTVGTVSAIAWMSTLAGAAVVFKRRRR